MIYNSILDTIGRTPLVRLSNMKKHTGFEILVKLEYFNPGGSIKDRTALSMITCAEQDGRLRQVTVKFEVEEAFVPAM